MRILLFCVALFFLNAMPCSTQTPVMDGPLGKMGPCPDQPNVWSPKDLPPMQRIPEGEYEMGDHLFTGWYDERPVHAVFIDAFHMDTFEVTNEAYCTYLNSAYKQGLIEVSGGVVYKKNDSSPYCDTTSSSSYSRITWDGNVFGITVGKEDHPMVMVSWRGAVAYANWRSTEQGLTPCYDLETWECTYGAGGYRLPTEAEWEKAARGGEHNPYYDYPWGNWISGSMANFRDSGDPFETGDYPWTTPVGYYDGNQFPPGGDMVNGYGLYDMAGGVWEWCNDWYSVDYYQYCVDHGIYDNPTGLSSGSYRVIRGGSWYSYVPSPRCANRHYFFNPALRKLTVGFRLILE